MNMREEYRNHYLKILIRGFDDFFIYRTSKEVSDDLDALLNTIPNKGTLKTGYFCFETADGANVALSINNIQMVNFLFDIGNAEKDDEGKGAVMDEVGKIYLRGKKDPFKTGFGEE